MRIVLLLLFIIISYFGYNQSVVSGYITDESNGENMSYVTVMIKSSNVGVVTNGYGFYSLSVDNKFITNDTVVVVISFMGYVKTEYSLFITKDVELNVKLKPSKTELSGVEIKAEVTEEKELLRSTNMSTTVVKAKSIKHIPTIGGEIDLVKVMQLLPGVSGGTEGTTSLFVRGGDADQNLVLLDEATLYNLGHLFGFFSVFNSDAINDFTMIKGAFPANYGGRLSSIMDVRMKEGNSTKFHGSGGIGLLSSRLMLEGPIIKEKMSFLISARRTYIDQVFKLVDFSIPYYFYDLNAKINYKISQKDRLFYSFYLGNDVLDYSEGGPQGSIGSDYGMNFGFNLGNMTHTLRWNHTYNPKLFSNVSLVLTDFDYDIKGNFDGNSLDVSSKIFDLGVKADFEYFRNNENHIKYGMSFTSHTFNPNIVKTSGEITSMLSSNEGVKMLTNEFALYAMNDMDLNRKFKINYGLRFSAAVVTEKVYAGLEPRLAARYLVSKNNSLKLSYSRMKQYLHRVASSTVALPTDLWYPITAKVKPQIADQVALGFNHLFVKNNISFEVELYYKKMQNLIEYREGASLVLNDNYENELLAGKGRAYGAEFLLRKERGKFTGWISYTLSKSTRQFDELNNGKMFPAKYDRRHNVSIVLSYKLSSRWVASAVWVYQSGARFTAQTGQYLMPNATMTSLDVIPIYTERNAVEMSPSHRLDVSLTFKAKDRRKFKSEWTIGCYNLYNRAQPYSVRLVPNDNSTGYKYEQPGLFGFIPSIAYNFNF